MTQAQSPEPNMKRHVYHSPKIGDDSNNNSKKGANGGGANLKSFFKMFKPHPHEKTMDKSILPHHCHHQDLVVQKYLNL